MGITQNKNIITYEGRKYKYTFDLVTRQADGDIEVITSRQPNNALELLVRFYIEYPDADGFYETLIKNAYINGNADNYYWKWYTLKQKMNSIKKHYHKMQKWATENDIKLSSPSMILTALEAYPYTQMEYLFYRDTKITNKEILSKYAYQFQKYRDYLVAYQLQTKIDKILETDGIIEKPSSILDFFLKTEQRYEEIKNEYSNQQMQKYYEKNKKYQFADGKYEYIVPSTIQQVKDEANMQHNCLYNLYLNKMLSDDYSNVIICVRDINRPTEGLYTIEYEPNNKRFKQCYAKCNSKVKKTIEDYLLKQIIGRE